MLTETERNKVQSWFKSKGVTYICEACKRTDWEIGYLVSAPIFSNGVTTLGGPVLPMVPVSCKNCGFIRLFSAILLGLSKP